MLFSFNNEKKYVINEQFKNLDDWREIDFGHKEHTSYKIISKETKSFMKSKSNGTATAMLYSKDFNVYDFPNLKWRWQVNNVFKNADLNSKDGDDFPLAVYILFKYDYKNMGYFEKMKYNTKKMVFGGEEPPHSTLRFVWSSYQEKDKNVYITPYQDSGRNLITEVGCEKCGKWISETKNIVEAYKEAFGEDPPKMATIGFMNDSDNTEEAATSYLDYIQVYSTEK